MERQRTLEKEVSFSGKALQTGDMVKVTCRPQEENEGIVFKRVDLKGVPVLRLGSSALSDEYTRRSTISNGKSEVQTVEHFLAALWALGIDNILVEIDGEELPAMDGSARDFLKGLKQAGIKTQQERRKVIKILEEEKVEEGDRSLILTPADVFSVSYSIEHDTPSIGHEVFDIELDQASFESEIAPARTFCLKAEAEALLKAGLGKGATYENTLVMDCDGPVGTVLRFSNEPLRHKILDLVGDLYMLGRPVIARVTARKSGHSLNGKMVQKIYEKYIKKESN